jgi:hypothetical protein
MFDDLASRVNGDAALVRRGRHVNVAMLLEAGDESVLVRIRDGAVTAVERNPKLMPDWTFALRAPREAWERFLAARPEPGFTDIFALQRKKLLRVEGNLHPFMANLLYFKGALASLRPKETSQGEA